MVKKEFKDHVGEMEKLRNAARERHNNSTRWMMFDDDDNNENSHPNLFGKRQYMYGENPFFHNCHENVNGTGQSWHLDRR